MTNDRIKTLLKNIEFYCGELTNGLNNNLIDNDYYSSRENHQSLLNKVEAIKLILKS